MQKSTLENGLVVVTESVPASRSISLGVLAGASPQDDPSGKAGLAHLTEHALFQGTSQRTALEIARLMDLAGGQMGAFTSRDYTCFYANVLDDYSTYALDLLGDMLLNSTFPAEKIDIEKQAILREMDYSRDNPADRVHALLKKNVWPEHPLGQSILGVPEELTQITRQDVVDFVQKYYCPRNMLVTAAGNVDHEQFVAHTRDAFWRLSGQVEKTSRECRFVPCLKIEHSDVSQAYFSLGIPSISYSHQDRYKLFIFNTLLGRGVSSRLFGRLREQRGLVYTIESEHHAYRDAGLLVVEGSTSPDHLESAIALILVELFRLASGDLPVDEEELWTAKMQIRGQHLLAGESHHTRMSRLATQQLYFGRTLPAEEILTEIDRVDLDDLTAFAAEVVYPALHQIGLSVVGPYPSQSNTARQLQQLIDSFNAVKPAI